MKSMRGRVWMFSTAAMAIAAMGWALSAGASDKVVEMSAKIIHVQGAARYSTDQKTWKAAKEGQVLKGQVLIQTAAHSMVDVCLHGGKRVKSLMDEPKENSESVIRVLENSVLGIDKLTREKTDKGTVEDVQLDLRSGDMMGTVGEVTEGSKYQIKLPKGMIGVHGGTYLASSGSVLNVLIGSAIIAVEGADGAMNAQRVKSHEGFDPTTGKVTRLSLEVFPEPLSCEGSMKPPPVSGPNSGVPHGPGMGGSLRRF